MQKLFDKFRGIWVTSQPEEIVRQKLLHLMVNQLGFPKSLISVEKEIDTLPHLSKDNQHKTNRRADIICFAKKIHPHHAIYPLLIVECKAEAVSDRVASQVLGYNSIVRAPFVAIAGAEEVRTYWYDSSDKNYRHVEGLPPYENLMKALDNPNNIYAYISR